MVNSTASSTFLLLASLCLARNASAFTALQPSRLGGTSVRVLSSSSSSSLLHMADSGEDDTIEALRAAAAKARGDADRLRQELGQTSPASETATLVPAKSADEVKSLLPSLLQESDLDKQAAVWNELKESKSLSQFGSANLRSFPVGLKMLEQRTGMTPASLGLDENEVDLDEFKYATLYVTGGCTLVGVLSLALLPQNIGATICYLVALIPILFLGIGSTAPKVIASAIAFLKGTNTGNNDAASQQERIVRHEAAHFCCGYWCGLPIAGYSTKEGVACVEFAVANNQYSATEVAALAVTGLAGLVGEAAQYDVVSSGSATADLLQLEQVFRRSNEFLGAAAQQDLTRWGALTASLLLRQHSEQYENVVKAFQRQAPLEECIELLEN